MGPHPRGSGIIRYVAAGKAKGTSPEAVARRAKLQQKVQPFAEDRIIASSGVGLSPAKITIVGARKLHCRIACKISSSFGRFVVA